MATRITILGSTGSVGMSTLEVVRRHPERFRISGLTAYDNVDRILEQCLEFRPEQVVMVDALAADQLRDRLADAKVRCDVQSGSENLDRIVEGMDCVVCAIVGAAGLSSTLAAVRNGCRVLIANKEPLVMLGPVIMRLASRHGAVILPLDSEHNAIFQCLPSEMQSMVDLDHGGYHGVHRLILTGSGGPFRERDPDTFSQVTPEEACRHPNWSMGRKISVDSATMMNKGLELIEACALFSMDESRIDIVVHPQSVIHSMVEYTDGSVLAQMANPDMKIPIAYGLSWPERVESGATRLDFLQVGKLHFEAPDHARFPSLGLARDVVRSGGTAPAVFNAANEVAVEAFLNGTIGFDRIPELATRALNQLSLESTLEFDAVMAADRTARNFCQQWINRSAA